ncbi:MAG TPA: Mur ligase family protein, partial [Bacteroidales bacterium]|nr:Mur ligase family protein [Bacteroidales bacterium]
MDRLRELILERFREKSIVLLGYGREGQSTYRLLREIFPGKELVIADRREEIRNDPSFGYDRHLQFITGAGYMDRLDGFDAVFRSPGIPVWHLIIGAPGQPAGNGKTGNRIDPDKITSQTSLFLECFAGQVIGVTGTKGKSTTSSLLHHLFKVARKETLLAGNIGNPVFHIAHLVTPSTTVVLELSSHQLEFLTRGPHTAILLNLYQEHLDAYADYESYQRAKANIARYQQEGDFLVWNSDDERVTRQLAPYIPYRRSFPFSLSDRPLNGGYPADGGLVFSDGGKAEEIWKIHQDRFLRG